MKRGRIIGDNHSRIAIVFSIFAILFLIANSIYLEVNKYQLISDLKLNPSISLETIHQIPMMIDFIVILWISLSLIWIFSLFFLGGTRCLPMVLLFLSVISLITMRIDTFVLGILSSIFFFKSLK